jgi:hypothetical protein
MLGRRREKGEWKRRKGEEGGREEEEKEEGKGGRA